jgi:hypothetical protein
MQTCLHTCTRPALRYAVLEQHTQPGRGASCYPMPMQTYQQAGVPTSPVMSTAWVQEQQKPPVKHSPELPQGANRL